MTDLSSMWSYGRRACAVHGTKEAHILLFCVDFNARYIIVHLEEMKKCCHFTDIEKSVSLHLV